MPDKSKISNNETKPDKFAGRERPYSLKQLNAGGVPPLVDDQTTIEQWHARREQIESIWLDCIGGIPGRVPVNYKFGPEFDEHNHIRRHLTYDTFDGDKVTAYLLIPKACLDKKTGAPAGSFGIASHQRIWQGLCRAKRREKEPHIRV